MQEALPAADNASPASRMELNFPWGKPVSRLAWQPFRLCLARLGGSLNTVGCSTAFFGGRLLLQRPGTQLGPSGRSFSRRIQAQPKARAGLFPYGTVTARSIVS